MILLAFYHPYFIVFDFVFLVAAVLIALLGKGGLMTTLHMSGAKYDAFHWFQEVADNLLHFKATNSSKLILGKADALATEYVKARQSRFSVLLRQYIGSLSLQVMLHTGLLGTAGWLLSKGGINIGPARCSRGHCCQSIAQSGFSRETRIYCVLLLYCPH